MEILKGFYLLGISFVLMTLIFNFEPRLPRFPWDMLVDKFGFRIYFPVTTSFAAAMLLLFILKYFNISF